MKVIDLQLYRTRKSLIELEKKIAQLSLVQKDGMVKEIKMCFKKWVKTSNLG